MKPGDGVAEASRDREGALARLLEMRFSQRATTCKEQGRAGHLVVVSDRQQFDALYDAHAGAVRAYVMRRGPVADADGVVAEVFLIAWRRLQDVPLDARGWLLAVARRVQSNARRS